VIRLLRSDVEVVSDDALGNLRQAQLVTAGELAQ